MESFVVAIVFILLCMWLGFWPVIFGLLALLAIAFLIALVERFVSEIKSLFH